jgi:DNA polymerase-3 subunit beta
MVATDSRRLAITKAAITTEGEPPRSKNPVVHQRAMAIVEKAIGSEPVHMVIGDNDVSFRVGSMVIVSQCVEGRFPAYEKVIPTKPHLAATAVAQPLLSAIRQSIIFTNEESRGVDLLFQDGSLRLATRTGDVGESKIDLPISMPADRSVDCRLDARYVADFIRQLDNSAVVTIQVIDRDSPVVMTTGPEYLYVIMPLSKD